MKKLSFKIKKLSKEEKEKIKLENKKIKKNDKLTKIFIYSLLGILILFLLYCLVSSIFPKFYLYSRLYFFNYIDGLLFYLIGYIPYASLIFLAIVIIFFMSVSIYYTIKINNRKLSIKKRNHYNNLLSRYCIILTVFMLFFVRLGIITGGYLEKYDSNIFINTKDKTYTKEDLINLTKKLADEIIIESDVFERNENGYVVTGDVDFNDEVIKSLHKASNKIPLLSGLYPKKSSNVNNLIRGMYGSDMAGLTHSYSTYFDYNSDPVNTLHYISHEFCHTKGISRESDTEFCSFYAGINSDYDLLRYSSKVSAFMNLNSALFYIDYDLANDIEGSVANLCLNGNKNEFCNLYAKNIDSYIVGSREIIIDSYQLKYYSNHKDELLDSLHILVDNGAKLYIDESEINIDEVINLIDKNSNDFLSIVIEKFNSNIFNKIEKAISNSKLYICVYQANIDRDVDDENIDNPASYYLEPLDEKDFHLYKFGYASVKYTYDRAARYYLEYYDPLNGFVAN